MPHQILAPLPTNIPRRPHRQLGVEAAVALKGSKTGKMKGTGASLIGKRKASAAAAAADIDPAEEGAPPREGGGTCDSSASTQFSSAAVPDAVLAMASSQVVMDTSTRAKVGIKRKKSGKGSAGFTQTYNSNMTADASAANRNDAALYKRTSFKDISTSATNASTRASSGKRLIITRKRLSLDGSPMSRSALGHGFGHLNPDTEQAHCKSRGEDSSRRTSRSSQHSLMQLPKQKVNVQDTEPTSEGHTSDEVVEAVEENAEDRDTRLLNSAPSWELNRLRKSDLVRLLVRLGTWGSTSPENASTYKKQELIDAVVMARDTTSARTSPAGSESGADADERLDGSSTSAHGNLKHSGSSRLRQRKLTDMSKGALHTGAQSQPQPTELILGGLDGRRTSYQLRQCKTSSASQPQPDGESDSSANSDDSKASTDAGDAGAEETDTGSISRAVKATMRQGTKNQDSALIHTSQVHQKEGITRAAKAAATLRATRTKNRAPLTGSPTPLPSSPYTLGINKRRLKKQVGGRMGVAFAASSPIRTRARRSRVVAAASGSALRYSTSSLGEGSVGARRGLRQSSSLSRSQRNQMWDAEEDAQEEEEVEEFMDHDTSAGSHGARQNILERDECIEAKPPLRQRQAKLNATNLIRDHSRHHDTEQSQQRTRASPHSTSRSDEDDSGDGGDEASSVVCSQRAALGLRPRTRSVSTQLLSRPSPASSLTSLDDLDAGDDDGDQAADKLLTRASQRVRLQDGGDSERATDSSEDDQSRQGMPPSAKKIRRLRNGKLRLPSTLLPEAKTLEEDVSSSDESMPEPEDAGDTTFKPSSDFDMADVSISSAAETFANAEVEMDEAVDIDEGEGHVDRDNDPMTNPSTASLSRLLKAQLLQLCEERGLHVDADLKKADLVQTLISSVDAREAIDSTSSVASQFTAKGSSTFSGDRWGRHSNGATMPLLRSHEKLIQDIQPPTPALTPTNAQAQPAEAVDELNGLDLESLNLVDKEIAASKLEKLEKIGSGGFKDVYVGKYKVSKARSMKVAIADLRDQLTEMDIKELSLLRDLKHENIVRFIGVSIPDDPRNVPCMIVSELCSNGDLFDYIRNVPAPSDSEIYRILLEIARGLEYLHLRKPAIIHRDVKSTNVLITRDRTAKINDFGLARVKNTTRSMVRSLVGTVNWQAVELWVPKPHYNEKVDVWSAAMTFWEVLQWHQPEKRYPFQGMNEHQIYQDVGQKRQRPYTGSTRRQFGGEIVHLLDRMWDQNPKERPSMGEVCAALEELIELNRRTKS